MDKRRGNKPTLEQLIRLCVNLQSPSMLMVVGYSEQEARRMMEEYERKLK